MPLVATAPYTLISFDVCFLVPSFPLHMLMFSSGAPRGATPQRGKIYTSPSVTVDAGFAFTETNQTILLSTHVTKPQENNLIKGLN